ncbi:ATP synthase F1 subunit delta [Natranaerofaba carboxydovora]|uniref:ATP synthase F1 subunit delta n=1 Tax=Natranaerofaba carboxydovora TaxID=2742683 RepID=UPI001F134F01|nr:ATP synthase F1 subunit delta [Natranaerofaba carboxydovora]UMZ75106.1 ATP synthase subunit delta [Natranaerofaba carboxydovora]
MSVGDRYATALFKVGKEKKILDTLEEGFTDLMSFYSEDKNFKKFFENPIVTNTEKKDFIQSIMKQQPIELKNFLKLLVDKNRENELLFIYFDFMDKVRQERNKVLCKVKTAYELTEDEKERLKEQLSNLTNKEVELENVVDNRIIGGIIIKVGDRVYDYSISGQLNQLRGNLEKTSLGKTG